MQCVQEPQKYKFQKCDTIADEESKKESGSFDYLQTERDTNKGARNEKKGGCYVMELTGKDISDEVKSLITAVEEGVN